MTRLHRDKEGATMRPMLGPRAETGATQQSEERRNLTRTVCLGSTTAGRSFMRMTLGTGIKIVMLSMKLQKVTITQTVTTTMMSSPFTVIHNDHQRDDCFLPRLRVTEDHLSTLSVCAGKVVKMSFHISALRCHCTLCSTR